MIIEKEFTEDECFFECDRGRIKQVVLNILSNAVEAISDGGTIMLRVYEKENNVFFECFDSGVGIDKKRMNNLFIPYQSTKQHGMGMGLMITKTIIEKHNGTIGVKSEGGKGCTVIVSVPKRRE